MTQITIATESLIEIAQAVNALRSNTKRSVSERTEIARLTDTSHTGLLKRAVYNRDDAAKKMVAACATLRQFDIDPSLLVADIDQTVPDKIECDCNWCNGTWTA